MNNREKPLINAMVHYVLTKLKNIEHKTQDQHHRGRLQSILETMINKAWPKNRTSCFFSNNQGQKIKDKLLEALTGPDHKNTTTHRS